MYVEIEKTGIVNDVSENGEGNEGWMKLKWGK